MEKHIQHNHWIDKIALLNALVSGITLYPQLYLIMATNYQEGTLSRLSFGLILSNSLVWFWYGVHRKTSPLIISSFLNVIASGMILLLI